MNEIEAIEQLRTRIQDIGFTITNPEMEVIFLARAKVERGEELNLPAIEQAYATLAMNCSVMRRDVLAAIATADGFGLEVESLHSLAEALREPLIEPPPSDFAFGARAELMRLQYALSRREPPGASTPFERLYDELKSQGFKDREIAKKILANPRFYREHKLLELSTEAAIEKVMNKCRNLRQKRKNR